MQLAEQRQTQTVPGAWSVLPPHHIRVLLHRPCQIGYHLSPTGSLRVESQLILLADIKELARLSVQIV
jgi:hypothetical protein